MSSKKEFVAFEGKKFVIEWYFDKRGTSRSLEYFESLNIFEQIKVLELFKLMANLGEIKNKTKFFLLLFLQQFQEQGVRIFSNTLSFLAFVSGFLQ